MRNLSRRQRKIVTRIFLLGIGLAFSCFILFHLILIVLYGSVTIYEQNKLILYQEIVMLTLFIIGYIYQLKIDTHQDLASEIKTRAMTEGTVP